jgi:hypothetical protein
MKKYLTFMLAIALILSVCAFPAMAAEDNRNAVISTEIDPSYIVTIPADLKVPYGQENTAFGAVTLVSANLEPDMCVKVTLSTDNLLENKADKNKTIAYTIHEGTVESVGDVFTFGRYFVAGDKTDLTVGITQDAWNSAYAGQYDDTVTFQIEYVAVQ